MSTQGGEPQEIDPLLGRIVLGRYRIVRELARGGMGAIYLARSEGAASFIKPVVIKRMLPEFIGDSEAAKMFKREARIMSLLSHPGIVSVFDFGREEQGYLLVMDYVHGFHFGRWAGWVQQKRGQVPVAIAVQVVLNVLEALQYAHTLKGPEGESLRVVHRDISPSNMLLDIAGHVKLADFGIAQSYADAPDVKTATRSVKGKFSYLTPEILDGGEPTPESDAYSAAVVLHEVLLGRNEFRTTSPTSTIARVMSHQPTRLDKARRDVSSDLADVVAYALNKRSEDRYASAADFARDLRKARRMEAEEAAALLADTFARDFRDPSLPAMYGLPDLDELERAWREPVAGHTSAPPAPSVPPRPTNPAKPERKSDEPTTGGKLVPSMPGAQPPAAATLGAAVTASAPLAPSAPVTPSAPIPIELTPGRLAVHEPTPSAPLATLPERRSTITAALIGAIVASVVAVVAVVAVVIVLTSQNGSGQEIVYVEATPAGIDQEPVEPAHPEPVEPGRLEAGRLEAGQLEAGQLEAGNVDPRGDPAPVDPPVRDPEPRTPRHQPELTEDQREAIAIQRAFGRHTSDMRRCFADAPPDAPRELTLRFSTTTAGRVESVDVTPAAVASTEPGRCVARIAQQIQFPPTPAARTFRIPIEVRSR